MPSSTNKCGLVSYAEPLSIVNKDDNMRYPLAKFEQFFKCDFG